MTIIELIESSMRGGAAALCVALIIQLLGRRPVSAAAAFGSLFLAGAGIYSVVALPIVREALGLYIIPFKLLGMLSPAFFWLFIEAIHDDNFKWRWYKSVPLILIGTLYLICIPFPAVSTYAKTLQVIIVALLMGWTIHKVRCCYRDDLVASRRHFGRTMRVLVPLIGAAIIGIEILETIEIQHAVARLAVAGAILGTGIILVISVLTLRQSLLPVAASPQNLTMNAEDLSAADRIDLGRLRDLMEEGAFMHSGLSIGQLASQMNIPEHRLRRLINNGLGYRNFAAFINDHRIAEAKRRLAEPSFAREQITGLAYDLGYTSLAPFNRAFRERTGQSPTEFREQSLTQSA
ncbi:helix-turn-helix domain-containing protein [Ahrensia marina]|uniref:helix-turn-helix domain-containing protein n=1 Tax=Ahrensia marina TaxID=1514904 RepID=UPI0006B4BA63|nr:AraC family transcriptional regulator [Ahrensia marina]